MKIERLLIANRGEIAMRIMRTAREMGCTVIAVYSNADKEARHVLESDEQVFLEGDSLGETYLNIEAIINAAKEKQADAVHPGYGFLSENPLFAEACENAGIKFIGPSSASIRAMGNKIAAREIAIKHEVPVTPGITGNAEELFNNHAQVGFPMLVKAAAGGGGKGMRIVNSTDELAEALKSTSSEAANYFGDGTIYIERFVKNPRHIEVQVLGDEHGNMIHLYERECSVQRRHQKVIEEAPSPTLTPEVRESICASAVKLASSIGYYNAGTIEFLVDDELNYYFLEMNTRIQVEHPVTEETTGIDIVMEQINIASGLELSYTQHQITQTGHSIEVRVYAEDPFNNFMPSPGYVYNYSYPSINSIRVDDAAIKSGFQIESRFDPMISKVIAWGETRQEAIVKLRRFLPHYVIAGIKTNLEFLYGILKHADYIDNRMHTRYLDNDFEQLSRFILSDKNEIDLELPLIGAMIFSFDFDNTVKKTLWNEIGYWRHNREIIAMLGEKEFSLSIDRFQNNELHYTLNNESKQATLYPDPRGGWKLNCGEATHKMYLTRTKENYILVKYRGFEFTFQRPDTAPSDKWSFATVTSHKAITGDIVSPMPGRVLSVSTAEGNEVKKGDLLMVIEAMKMENNIKAPYDGVIDKIMIKQGDNVDANERLVHMSVNVVE